MLGWCWRLEFEGGGGIPRGGRERASAWNKMALARKDLLNQPNWIFITVTREELGSGRESS